MIKNSNRILSFILAVILIIGSFPINILASNDANIDDVKIKDETKLENNIKDNEIIESEVKTEEQTKPKIIEDSVEINTNSELIEVSPVGANELPPLTSLNTEEEILPSEALGSKIENVSINWIDYPNQSLIDADWTDGRNSSQKFRFRIKFDLSGQNFYKEGAISMIIPKQIFKDRKDNYIGGMTLAVPEAPDKRAAFAYMDLGDKYLITNTKPLSPATTGYIEGTITGISPRLIRDKSTGYKSDDLYVDLKADIYDGTDENKHETIGMKSESLNVQAQTLSTIQSAYKNALDVYENPLNVPKEFWPENHEDYVYVKWATSVDINGNQPFDLNFEDTLNPDDKIPGTILGYVKTSNGEKVVNKLNNNTISGDIAKKSFGDNFYLTVYSAYPKADMKNKVTYTFNNTIKYNLTNLDNGKTSERSDSAKAEYTPITYQHTGDVGSGSNAKSAGYRYGYALNSLKNNQSVDSVYNINVSEFRHSSTMEEGANQDNPKSYNKVPYTVEIEDGDIELNDKYLQSSDDYQFKSLSISNIETYQYKKVDTNSYGYIDYGSYKSTGTIYAGKYGYVKNTDEEAPNIEVFGKVDGINKKLATISSARNISTENGARFDDNKILFPENTTSFNIKATTTHSAIMFNAQTEVTLKPSDNILSQVDKMFEKSTTPTTRMRNTLRYKVYNGGSLNIDDTASASNVLESFSARAYLKKSLNSFNNNTGNRELLLRYSISSTVETNIKSRDIITELVKNKVLNEEKTQTWYDLLPPGVIVKTDSISIAGGTVLNKKIIKNFRDSGRDLLVVKTSTDPNYSLNYNYHNGNYYYSNTLRFDAVYTWEMLRDYGPILENVAAYKSDNGSIGIEKGYTGEPDDPSAGNNVNSKSVSKYFDLLKNLDEYDNDEPAFLYTKSADTVYADTWAIVNLYKHVSVNGEGAYGDGMLEEYAQNVYENGPYTYRLSIKNPDDIKSKNIILYDSLENHVPNEKTSDYKDKQWKGELVDVDTLQLKQIGADPVVYYSTVPNLDLSCKIKDGIRNKNLDITDRNIWTTVKPSSGVTAVAIDISKDKYGNDFVLKSNQGLSAYINMKAPTVENLGGNDSWYDVKFDSDKGKNEEGLNGGAHAYNEASAKLDVITTDGKESKDNFINNLYTKVGIKPFKIDVEKTFNDDNNRDGIRSDEITMELLNSSKEVVKAVVLNKENEFKGSFGSVPYLSKDGVAEVYTLKEKDNDKYKLSVRTIKDGDHILFKAVNTHEPERITISGKKKFVGANPTPVLINAYANDKLFKSILLNDKNDFKYSIENLYKYENGEEIKYEIKENYIPGFISKVDGYDVVNTYNPYGNLVIKKETLNGTEKANKATFKLLLEFFDKEGKPLYNDYKYTSSTGKTGTVTSGSQLMIKKDEVITINNVDSDGSYKITELDIPGGFSLDAALSSNLTGSVKAGETVNALLVNEYKTFGEFVPSIRKELINRKLGNYQFVFEVLDSEKNIIKVGSNMGTGQVLFSSLKYSNEDIDKPFVYYIRERDTKFPGYTYDLEERKITAIPRDNGDGTISVECDYGAGKSEVLFKNEYHAKGSLNLKAWKALIAHKLQEGQFEFELYGDKPHGHKENSDTLSIKAKNNSAGVVDFNIDFDEQDIGKTFVFRAKEIPGNDKTMIYDSSEVEYTIKVFDNGNGTVSFDATAKDLDTTVGNDEATPLLVNRYKNGSLTIEKLIQGTYEGQKVFKFIIKFIGEKEVLPNENLDIKRSEAGISVGFTLGRYTDGKEEFDKKPIKFDTATPGTGKILQLPEIKLAGNDVIKYGFSFTDEEKYYDNEVFTQIKYDVNENKKITKIVGINKDGKEIDITNKLNDDVTMFIQALPGRMMWKNEYGVVTIYPENGIVAESVDKAIYNKDTSKQEKLPTDIKEVKSIGNLLFNGDLSFMFYFSSAKKIDLSNFNTSKVTNMRGMFSLSKATTLDLSSFDTSNVTDMSIMFDSIRATKLDVSNFNTSNVTDMGGMFQCSTTPVFDVSNFYINENVKMEYMFWQVSATAIYVRTQADKDRMSETTFNSSPNIFIVGKPPTPLNSSLNLSEENIPHSVSSVGTKASKAVYPYAIEKGYITKNNYVKETMTQGGVTIDIFDNGQMIFRPTNGVSGEMVDIDMQPVGEETEEQMYKRQLPWIDVEKASEGKVAREVNGISFENGVIAPEKMHMFLYQVRFSRIDFNNFNTSNVREVTNFIIISFEDTKLKNNVKDMDLSPLDLKNAMIIGPLLQGQNVTNLQLFDDVVPEKIQGKILYNVSVENFSLINMPDVIFNIDNYQILYYITPNNGDGPGHEYSGTHFLVKNKNIKSELQAFLSSIVDSVKGVFKISTSPFSYAYSNSYITYKNKIVKTITHGDVIIDVFDNGHAVFRPSNGNSATVDNTNKNENSREWAKYKNLIKSISFESKITTRDSANYMFADMNLDLLDLINLEIKEKTTVDNIINNSNVGKILTINKADKDRILNANGNINEQNIEYSKYPYSISKGYITMKNKVVHTNKVGGVTVEVFDNNQVVLTPANGKEGTLDSFSGNVPWPKWFNYDDNNWRSVPDFLGNKTGVTRLSFSVEKGVKANTDSSGMFSMAQSPVRLGNVDLTNLDTSSVTNMSTMFYASFINNLNLSGFDISNVTDMSGMFYSTQISSPIDLSSFNKNKTTNMSKMFFGCSAPEINISNLDTSNVTDMSDMFSTTKFKELNLSNFDTSNVTNMNSMFNGANVESLSISSFNTSSVTDMSAMFESVNLERLDLSNFNTANVKDMRSMFSSSHIQYLDTSSFDTSNVTNMSEMFDGAEIDNFNISHFNTSNVVNMNNMFKNTKNLDFNFSNFDTSNVRSMNGMFKNVRASTLDLSSFNTSNVEHMESMFSYAKIKQIDLSNFDMRKVKYNNDILKSHFIQKVTLSDKTKFKSWNDRAEYLSPYIETKKGNFTNKWVKEDKSDGPYTSKELEDLIESDPIKYSGTWIIDSPTYTIHFDPNGGSGSMSDISLNVHDSVIVPDSTFSYLGKRFTGWTFKVPRYPISYSPGETIGQLTNIPETITLYAQWEDIGDVKGLGDNMYEVYIPGNSKVTIKDLPAGLAYEIYEETEKGWVLVNSTNASGTIKPTENTKAQFINEKTNDKVAVSFEGKKLLDGKGASGYKFEVLQGGKVISTSTSIDGSIKFEPIVLSKVGTYKYTIREVNENNPAIVYDNHEEQVEVVVTRNSDDDLVAKINGDKDGIVFKNSRKKVKLELDVKNLIPNKYLPNGLTEGLSPYETNQKFSFKLIRNDNTDTPEIITLPESGKVNIDVNYGDKLNIEEVKLPKGFRLKGFNNTNNKSVTIYKIISDTKVTAENIYEPRGMFNLNVSKNMAGRNAIDGEFFYQVKTYDTKGNIIDLPLVENKAKNVLNLDKNVEITEDQIVEKIKNNAKNYPKYSKEELADLSKKLLNRDYDSDIRTNINNKIFDDIMFARIGTQYIAINELPYNINLEDNIEFDTEPVIAKITGKDNGDGTIATTIEYINKKQAFNNSLKPGKLQITKILEGDSDSKFLNKEFKATIKLFDKEGTELADSYKAGYGTIKSGDLISLVPNKPITIEGLPDGATYEVVEESYDYFELSDKSITKGKIEAGKTAESKIINIFKPSGKFEILINKTLENADIKDYSFNFLLVENNKVVAEVKNNQEGKAVLKTFNFSMDDVGKEFEYKIVEGKDNNSSIVYDDTVHTLKFKVVEKDGKISAVIDGKEEDSKTFNFANKYVNTAGVKIFKVGESEKPLSDIEFELLDANKENIIKDGKKVIFKTGDDGYSNIIEDLQVGKYYLKELNTPEGYLEEDFIEFEIEKFDLNTVKTISVINRKLLVLPVTGLPYAYHMVLAILLLIIMAYIFDRKLRKMTV